MQNGGVTKKALNNKRKSPQDPHKGPDAAELLNRVVNNELSHKGQKQKDKKEPSNPTEKNSQAVDKTAAKVKEINELLDEQNAYAETFEGKAEGLVTTQTRVKSIDPETGEMTFQTSSKAAVEALHARTSVLSGHKSKNDTGLQAGGHDSYQDKLAAKMDRLVPGYLENTEKNNVYNLNKDPATKLLDTLTEAKGERSNTATLVTAELTSANKAQQVTPEQVAQSLSQKTSISEKIKNFMHGISPFSSKQNSASNSQATSHDRSYASSHSSKSSDDSSHSQTHGKTKDSKPNKHRRISNKECKHKAKEVAHQRPTKEVAHQRQTNTPYARRPNRSPRNQGHVGRH